MNKVLRKMKVTISIYDNRNMMRIVLFSCLISLLFMCMYSFLYLRLILGAALEILLAIIFIRKLKMEMKGE